ncbi:MAG: hypothetical protein HY360_08640 [Verrucomicrobia bacterium]|nr:hypothetical protein [Verrucomicrobiota bacterium]
MTEKKKPDLVDDHGKLVYQRNQDELSKRLTLKPVVDRLPAMEAVLSPETVKPKGHWEEVEMPDTLDLAERAALGVNALIGNMKPDQHYAGTQTFRFGILGPYDDHPNWAMPMKFLRCLPLMRVMCGSEKYVDVEIAATRAVLQQVAKDGQVYFPISKDGPPAGTCYPATSGLAALACFQRHASDGNSLWLDWAKVICDGLRQVAIETDDYAYYPPEWAIDPQGKWHWTLRGPGNLAKAPREPVFDQEGYEGSVKWDQCKPIKSLLHCYNLCGDQAALECARKLVRFCLKPNLWKDTHDPVEQALDQVRNLVRECVRPGYPAQREDRPAPGHEHGLWEGHCTGNLRPLQALLMFAQATGDERLKQITREGYEHARRHGVIRLGFVPSWINSAKYGRPTALSEVNETCGIAGLLLLAVMLTDAGVGDYWDDVDSMIRNHFIELQITDLDLMKKVAGAGSEYNATFKRIMGGFATAHLTSCRESMTNACCIAQGTRSLYHAWEGITRFADGVATVNLFLNRVSPWMNVCSYLPYEGKVVLHNKQAHTILVRIPYWVNPQKLTCFLGEQPIRPPRAGNYVVVKDLHVGEMLRLQFPVAETTETYTICGTRYTARFRGSTVVDINPRDSDTEEFKNCYPFFRRDHLKAPVAPRRKAKRFVADQLPATP